MKLLADECCDHELVTALRADGHDVLYVIDNQRGAEDPDLLDRAWREHRLLLTEDKDFGELVVRLAFNNRGVILLRFPPSAIAAKTQRCRHVLNEFGSRLGRAFTVVTPTKLRIRPLPS